MCVRHYIERGMQLVRSSSIKQSGLSSLVRNASFSSGWLHLAVQCFFAVITVASFILIVLMAIPTFPDIRPVPDRELRCRTKNCMVICRDVPYYGKYDDDIVYAVSELPNSCMGFYLALQNAYFVNETLPANWFPRLRLPIHELAIIGGNLMHFPTSGFLSPQAASISTLVLYDLKIKSLSSDSFVGLSNLEQLFIYSCTIDYVQGHLLRPVHDTLKFLTITMGGLWNPANITGTNNLMNLKTVDFSNNTFYDVLDQNSFTGLEGCTTLYLNSCKITSIAIGTFDHLHSIETLYLNENLLVTIPERLFAHILLLTSPKPRINLQDNLWYCDCLSNDIRQLVTKDMLLTDPTCSAPEQYNGKTFTDLELYCQMDYAIVSEPSTSTERVPINNKVTDISGVIYVNNGCYYGRNISSDVAVPMLSLVQGHECVQNEIQRKIIQSFNKSRYQITTEHNWIKFTYLIKTKTRSIVQIGASDSFGYGLMWYQSTCPNEMYCINVVPSALRVYNVDMSAHYVFCPLVLATGNIATEKCISYNFASIDSVIEIENQVHILLYLSTGGICLVIGALCVYALVRKHPYLLKGSKRILFVKHKKVDALVLPPKVPVRNDLMQETNPNLDEKKIFIVPAANSFGSGKFNRNKSTRSSKSNAPSYISALQPTEDQLAEWRIRNHFANDSVSEPAAYSWMCNADSYYYTDVIDNDKTYESLK